jgi:hypothetical protein
LHELLAEIGEERAETMRAVLNGLTLEARRERLRREWARLLGAIEPTTDPEVTTFEARAMAGLRLERLVLDVEPGIAVPMLLLPLSGTARSPVVIALSEAGKSTFLRERAGEIAELLASGLAVCLPDVRGTGETRADPPRAVTGLSATELMLGQTLLGSRLRDLRSVLRFLRARSDLDASRMALWGDSIAPTNPVGFADPLLGEGEPPLPCEPLGGMLALFGALYENDVRAVLARGIPAGFQAILRDRFCYVPHDAIVPGALTAGDLGDVAAALAPRPLRLEQLVDGRNCPIAADEAERAFAPALAAYATTAGELILSTTPADGAATWLAHALQGPDARPSASGSRSTGYPPWQRRK